MEVAAAAAAVAVVVAVAEEEAKTVAGTVLFTITTASLGQLQVYCLGSAARNSKAGLMTRRSCALPRIKIGLRSGNAVCSRMRMVLRQASASARTKRSGRASPCGLE